MKLTKKLATFMLTVCLLVPCFSMMVFAADGEIMFTDPSTKAGETVEVKGVIKRNSGNFGKMQVTMSYDTALLDFVSGDHVTESSSGTLVFSYDATPINDARVEFNMKFTALQKGTATIKVTESAIKNVAGTVLNYTKGSSTITIAEGTNVAPVTPSQTSDATVEVNGETYRFADAVPQNEIPEGYEAATLEYDLVNYNVVYSSDFGLYLAYLVDEDNAGSLFMYVEENATFAPYEAIKVTDDITIALLSDVTDIILPAQYKETEIVLNGREFPGWQDKENIDFCIIYAINNNGEKSLYQMDTAEGTYQRFFAPEIVVEELRNPIIAKLSDLLQNHLDYVILGTGLGFLLLIVIIVVLSVKLYNRNAELDEIYDEYGLDNNEDGRTEDDIFLDIDDDSEEEQENGNVEMESFVQAGLRELFPEPNVEEEPPMVVEKVAKEEQQETLGEALQQQKEVEQEQEQEQVDNYDDEDPLEDFSVDFLDLDD